MSQRTKRVPLLVVLAIALPIVGLSSCKPTKSEKLDPASEGGPASDAVAPSDASTVNAQAAGDGVAPDAVVVYYFHGDKRCRTCEGIQSAISRTVGERFSAETASGLLQFHDVNIDEPANTHFVQDFSLGFSSMVVAATKGDQTLQWKNSEKVWPLARDETKLMAYAEEQIRSYLELVETN